jgi:heme exporter protein A
MAGTMPAMSSLAAAPASASAFAARVLAAAELACRRGDRVLFKGLNFALLPGQILWLRGNNGRGKTSLLRLIAGLSPPEAGVLRWGAHTLREAGPAYRSQLLYLAHANALKDDLSVVEALAFLAALHGQSADRPALLAALTQLGMASRCDAPVRTLSQGQRRRVALARLAIEPHKTLWVLDEPYDALDGAGCACVDALLSAHAARGGSVVLTSHLPLAITSPLPVQLVLEGDAA